MEGQVAVGEVAAQLAAPARALGVGRVLGVPSPAELLLRRPARIDRFRGHRVMLAMELNGATASAGAVSVQTGELIAPLSMLPSPAEGDAASILGCVVGLLRTQHRQALELGTEVIGMGMGVPGPFDYELGLSLRTTGKLSALHGFDLRATLERELGLPVRFCNNAVSFATGAWRVEHPGAERFVGVILTTGGSAVFLEHGRVAPARSGAPLAGGVDVFSVTRHGEAGVRHWAPSRQLAWYHPKVALEEGYARESGGARPLSLVTRADLEGDRVAVALFRELGEAWGEVLATLTQAFAPEVIAFGGLLSASAFELFGEPMSRTYHERTASPARLVKAGSLNLNLIGAAQHAYTALAGV